MPIPDALRAIANDVYEGKTRRLKVRTLFGYYKLYRRRAAGISAVRSDLATLGVTTEPPFETAGFDDQVRIKPVGAPPMANGEAEEGASEARPFSFEPDQTLTKNRHSLYVRNYTLFSTLRHQLEAWDLASVIQAGQNSRRLDRDHFPFYITFDFDEGSPEELEDWVKKSQERIESDTTEYELSEPEDEQFPPTVESSPQTLDLKQHTADMAEYVALEVKAQTNELRAMIEAKIEDLRFDAINKLAKQINNQEAMKVMADFEAEMRQKLRERETEIIEANKELSLSQERYDELQLLITQQPAYDPTDAYPTVGATIELFDTLSESSPIFVHAAAHSSAKKCFCRRRRELLLFMLKLQELAESLFVRDDCKKPLEEWFSGRGYEYAAKDSQTTASKFGGQREIDIEGKRVQLKQHVTLFPNTSDCITIYFDTDKEAREIIIGYIGKHLKTAGGH